MRAAALDFSARRLVRADLPEPVLREPSDVRLRIIACGVCGTDRDLANFHYGSPPPGSLLLVLGHEALGQVVETGPAATGLEQGDWVVPAVRRPCIPPCRSCASGRRDLCVSGGYTERGIFGAHGYLCDFAVDCEADLIRVPPPVAEVAVLAEPLSVVEKAAERACDLHAGEPRRALILGAGTIGILSALVLRELGMECEVQSQEPADSDRARLVKRAGFRYGVEPGARFDVVFEATGSAEAVGFGLDRLNPLGVLMVLGAPASGDLPLIGLIGGNQVIAGSVNAGPRHWSRAVERLAGLDRDLLASLIHRVSFDCFRESILGPAPQRPKLVHMLD